MLHGQTIPEGLIVITPLSKVSPCPTCKYFSLGKDTDVNGTLAGPCDNCQPLEDYRAFIEGRAPIDLVAVRAAEAAELHKIWPRDSRRGGGAAKKKKYTLLCPYCEEMYKTARPKSTNCQRFECAKKHRLHLNRKYRAALRKKKQCTT